MSEVSNSKPRWWQKKEEASLKRRQRAVAAPALAKPGDAFLVVTEGTVTEPVYFNLLLDDLQLSVVRIKVRPGDASDPRHVIRTAAREAREQERKARKHILGINEPPKFEHVWAVVDTDVAKRQQFWNDVHQLADGKKVTLVHSTPCFEVYIFENIGESVMFQSMACTRRLDANK